MIQIGTMDGLAQMAKFASEMQNYAFRSPLAVMDQEPFILSVCIQQTMTSPGQLDCVYAVAVLENGGDSSMIGFHSQVEKQTATKDADLRLIVAGNMQALIQMVHRACSVELIRSFGYRDIAARDFEEILNQARAGNAVAMLNKFSRPNMIHFGAVRLFRQMCRAG